MDTMHSVIALRYTQERIARAQVERLAKDARDVRSGTHSPRRTFRFGSRPVVARPDGARR
jgi:hypothetical protein